MQHLVRNLSDYSSDPSLLLPFPLCRCSNFIQPSPRMGSEGACGCHMMKSNRGLRKCREFSHFSKWFPWSGSSQGRRELNSTITHDRAHGSQPNQVRQHWEGCSRWTRDIPGYSSSKVYRKSWLIQRSWLILLEYQVFLIAEQFVPN